jgi:cytochrome c oxidase assembly protein subunit 15
MGPSSSAAAPALAPATPLYRYAVAVVLVTLFLIKVGAMVTSTGSGMAFSDWPLANASWWPPDMGLDQLLEHGHRAIGMAVGCLILALTIWIGARERRGWLRKLAVAVLGLVVLQGLLGGMRIEWERWDPALATTVAVVHGALAQVLICALALVAFALSPAWENRDPAPAASIAAARRMGAIALIMVFAQLVIGATARHTGATGALWLHVAMALLIGVWILVLALYCATRFPGAPGIARLSRAVLVLLVLQLVLGFVTLMVRRVKDPSNIEYLGRSLVATSHVLVGALLFLSAALLWYRTLRNLEPAPFR